MKNLLGLAHLDVSALAKRLVRQAGRAIRFAFAGALLYGALGASTTVATAAEVQDASAPAKPGYIALLLPGQAKAFKSAVDNIRAGVLAGERVHGGTDAVPLRVFDTTDKEEDIQQQFKAAVEGGALAVIGPLTKSALNFLADSTELKVPVVALNNFDQTTLPQAQLFSFGLGVEADAAGVAQLVQSEGLRQPLILLSNDPIALRQAQGFAATWKEQTGSEPVMVTMGNPKRDASQLKTQLAETSADAVFLAMDAKSARMVRPFIGNEIPVYATSQIYPARLGASAMVDLAGVKYLEMPWLANPDQDGYDLYIRNRSNSNDLERLFALGVDAWQVAAILAKGGKVEQLDGLTGVLNIGRDNVVTRQMVVRTLH
ncbi:penicillin-binding protein activator [Chitinibacter sp. S2-10]|uniref:penicillin-binding protein activator n=1 Tax=Chitinibacter sp. S2-10 TaxID=3373597 RepID=UPI00397759D2